MWAMFDGLDYGRYLTEITTFLHTQMVTILVVKICPKLTVSYSYTIHNFVRKQ